MCDVWVSIEADKANWNYCLGLFLVEENVFMSVIFAYRLVSNQTHEKTFSFVIPAILWLK